MRPALGFAIVALAALGCTPCAFACSQCLCGTPFPADALGGVVPYQLRYGIEDRYLSKSNGLEDGPGSEREREHRVAAFALWRPSDRVVLLGRLPYNVKEISESPVGDATVVERTQGWGDAELQVLAGLAQTQGAHHATLGLVVGAMLPTGRNDRRDGDGERLDAHLQPGSGAWAASAGLNFGYGTSRGTCDASVIVRTNSRSHAGYRYGDALLYNAGYTSPARRGWQLTAQLNGRSARRDRLEDGELGGNTGGTVLYAAPGLRWFGGAGVGLEALLQIPLAQSLYGDQDEHTTARMGILLGR